MPGIEQNEDQPDCGKYTVELGVAARFENPWELYAQPVQVQYARKGIRESAIKEETHCECESLDLSLSSLSESSQNRTQTDNNVEVRNIFNDTSNMELNLAEATSTSEQTENQTKNGILYTFEEIASVDRKYSIDELEDTLATDNFEISSKLYPSDSGIDNVMNRNYDMASSNTSNMSMDKTLSESENSLEHLNLTSSSDNMSGINKQDQSQSETVSSPDTTLETEPQTKPKAKGKGKGKGGSSKLTSYLKGLTKKHKATDANQTETTKHVSENEKIKNCDKSTDGENVESSEKRVVLNEISELKSNITDPQSQTTDLLSVIGSSVDPINIDGNKFVNSVEKMSDKPNGINDLSTEYTNPNSPSVTMDINQTATSILSTVPQYTTVSHQTVNKDNVQINTSGENIDFNVLSSSQIKSDDVITETRNKSDLNFQSDSNDEGSKKLDSFFKNVKSESEGKPRKGEKSSISGESVNSGMDISNTLQTDTLSPILVEFSNSESKMDDSFSFDVFSSDQTNSLEPGINNMSAGNNVFDDKSLDLENQSLVTPEKEESPASVISDSGFLSQGSFIEDSKISESFSNDQLKSPNSEGNNLESIIEVSQADSMIMDSVSSPSQTSYVNDFLGNDSFSMLQNEPNFPEIGLKKAVKEDSFEDDLYEVNPSIIYESTDIQDRYFDQTPLCEQPIIEEDESLISPPFASDDLPENGTNQFQFGDDFVDITPHSQTQDNDDKDFVEVFKKDDNETSLKENQDSWLEECVDATDVAESGKYLPDDKDSTLEDSYVEVQQDDYQLDDQKMSDENLDGPDVVDERNFGNDYEIVLGNKPMKEFTVADFTNPDNQISERTLVERQLMDTALVSDHFGKDTSYRGDTAEPIETNKESELLDAPKSDRIDEDSEFSKTNILENIADIEEFVTETLQSEQQSSSLLDEHICSDNVEKEHLDSEHVDNEQCSLVESPDTENFQEKSDIHDPYDEFFDEIEKTDQVTESYLAINDQLKVEDLMTKNLTTNQDDVLELEETPKYESNSNSVITENFDFEPDETISKSVTKNDEIPEDNINIESIATENYEITKNQTNSESNATETNKSPEELTNIESGTTEIHQIPEDETKSQLFTAEYDESTEDQTNGESETTESHLIPEYNTMNQSCTAENDESTEDQTNGESGTTESHFIPEDDTMNQSVHRENYDNIFVEEVVNNENIDQCKNELAEVKQNESSENMEGGLGNNEEIADFEEIQKKNMEMFMKLQDNEATLLNLQDEIIRSSEFMDEPRDHQNTHSDDNHTEEDNNVSKDVDDLATMSENIIRDSVDMHQETDSQEFHQNDQIIATSTPQASSLPHYMRQQDVTPVQTKPPLHESLSNQNTPSKQSKDRSKSFNEKDHESSYSEFDEDIIVEPISNLRKMFENSRDETINISPTKSSPKHNQSKYVDNKTENVDIEVISSATPLEEVTQPSTSVRNMLRMWEINKKEQEEMSPRPFNKLSKKWHSCGHIYYKSDNEADSWGNGVTDSDGMAGRPSSNDSDSRQQRPNKVLTFSI
ncbi:hypothetical protein LOTGIDRAFT_160442 [Lottia gigantea]|uniref:Uncharacterized protein n=1 Tax=Lottia gigantea TaxID=225164 RepID=V4ANT8_LOTGI|nr:hypothetical protein LOTGIDRAFT_160442 [Lottia gigantea]ESO95316.1 hypothetical protein LOTGIDRAFT_160442 [Lottia gigantea]